MSSGKKITRFSFVVTCSFKWLVMVSVAIISLLSLGIEGVGLASIPTTTTVHRVGNSQAPIIVLDNVWKRIINVENRHCRIQQLEM